MKLLAYYLPQFHPTPENDEWWGTGFTEWTNVTKAQPLWADHYQPHLPADLGFYDLRLRQSRHAQNSMALTHGVDGFCYHYYWFSGKRLLWEPLEDMLVDSAPEAQMPFCLCWANENWTRRWNGAEQDVLIAQNYAPEDDLQFIQDLERYLRDPRYIRLDGAAFVIVYMPQRLPNPTKTLQVWRDYCQEAGIGKLHLCAALTHGNTEYAKFGFDSGIEFPPHNMQANQVNDRVKFSKPHTGHVMEMADVAESYLKKEYAEPNVFRTVFPSWDNTARTVTRAVAMLNGTPANYEAWLKATVERSQALFGEREHFVFVNAWNEWAEGCHLEPDQRYGKGFLEATLRVKSGNSAASSFVRTQWQVTPELATLTQDLAPVLSLHMNQRWSRLKRAVRQRPWLHRFARFVLRRSTP